MGVWFSLGGGDEGRNPTLAAGRHRNRARPAKDGATASREPTPTIDRNFPRRASLHVDRAVGHEETPLSVTQSREKIANGRLQCVAMPNSYPRPTNETTIAIGLTMLLAALLAAFLWWDHRQSTQPASRPTPSSSELGDRRARSPSVSAPKLSSQALGGALYRCDSANGTTYQSSSCEGGSRQAEIVGGTFNVVTPPPPPARSLRADTGPAAPRVGFISQAEHEGAKHMDECAWHERAIADIDALARQRSTGQWQEWLRERRRHHKDAMWSLKCGM